MNEKERERERLKNKTTPREWSDCLMTTDTFFIFNEIIKNAFLLHEM